MRRVLFALAGVSASCLMVSACTDNGNSQEQSAKTGSSTEASSAQAQVTDDDAPTDGSIVCPGSRGCPQNFGLVGQPWYGVLVPGGQGGVGNQPNGDNLVCISGRKDNPEKCPDGYNGRLWKAPEGQKDPPPGSSPNLSVTQQICAPGYGDSDICPGDTNYAFLCKGKKTACPGVPQKKPPKPEDEERLANQPPTRGN